MAGIARKWIARRASHLLYSTEPLFVVSSYRGSINAGPRIDPARFRFRRLFVQSLRSTTHPEWIHRVGPIPLIAPLANRSVGFCRRTAGRIAGDLWRFTSRINEPGTKKIERARSPFRWLRFERWQSLLPNPRLYSVIIYSEMSFFRKSKYVQHPLSGVVQNRNARIDFETSSSWPRIFIKTEESSWTNHFTFLN